MTILEAVLLIRDLDTGRWPGVVFWSASEYNGKIEVDMKCGDYRHRALTRDEADAWLTGLHAGRALGPVQTSRGEETLAKE